MMKVGRKSHINNQTPFKFGFVFALIISGLLSISFADYSFAFTSPGPVVPTSFMIDFNDRPYQFQPPITCNPDTGSPYECFPAHHNWLKSKGIDITGTPNGVLHSNTIVGDLGSTGVVIGYDGGLSEGEVLTIHLLHNSLAKMVEVGLATAASDSPEINNVPATVIMKAYDTSGELLGETTTTFTGVTNGQYTSTTIKYTASDYLISKVSIELAPSERLPSMGIFINGLNLDKIDTQPIPDTPPVLTLPSWGGPGWAPTVYTGNPEGDIYDYDYQLGSDWFNAYDDKDGFLVPTCEPLSGTMFSVGEHTITCTAVDSAGNVGTASFTLYIVYFEDADPVPAEPSSPLFVNLFDLDGNRVFGAPISLSQGDEDLAYVYADNGEAIFTLSNSEEYTVIPQDSAEYTFDHWLETGSTSPEMTVSIDSATNITAIYQRVEQPAPTEPIPTPQGTFLRIMVLDAANSQALIGYYIEVTQEDGTVVHRTWSSFGTAVGLFYGHEYTVSIADYDGYYFNYWQDTGSTIRTRTVVPGEQETITAIYSTDPGALPPATDPIPAPQPAPAGNSTLVIRTEDGSGQEISGYYVALALPDGTISHAGFSPSTFTIDTDVNYSVYVSDYGQYAFDYWKFPNNSTRVQNVNSVNDGSTTFTAVYRNINEPPSAPEPVPEPVPAPESEPVPSAPPGQSSLMVWSKDESGNRIDGYYTVLTKLSNGNAISSFTPTSFVIENGVTYTVSVSDYGRYAFDHWEDTGSIERVRTVSLMEGKAVTAIYRDVNSPPSTPSPSPSPQPAPGSTTVSVRTTDAQGNAITGYYVTLWQNGAFVQSGFSPAEFTLDESLTYQVAVSDYGSYSFSRWADGDANRFHAAASGDSLTAVYRP